MPKSKVTAIPSGKNSSDKLYVPRQLYQVKVIDLTPDPDQPRKVFDPDELNEMVASLKEHGMIQPVLFRCDDQGELYIVAGERRLQAAKLADLDEIPAIYTEGKPAELALVENMVRADLTALEEAEGLKRLQEQQDYSNKQLADVIGKSQSTISEILSLNKLPKKIKDKIRANKSFSKRQLIEIAKLPDEKAMKKAFKSLEKHNSSSDDLREKIRGSRSSESVVKTMVNSLISKMNDLDLDCLEDEERENITSELKKLSEFISEKISTN